MAEVVLENISKRYANGVTAVRDLRLCVADGELFVLVGPSGCGKTTTLRLVAGLEEPTQGTVRIGSRVVTQSPPRERDVAMVFQRPALYPHLSVRDNLAFGVRMRQHAGWLSRWMQRWFRPGKYAETVRRDQGLAAQVSHVARMLHLEEVLNRLPAQLSGGQQQRVALGRALVRQPAVYLLDEPLSDLDVPLRSEMRRELHLLQRRFQATMIYVTHDQVEAMTLGDRVAVLDRGILQQVGRPLELYERPANQFVAGFIGWPPMSFVEGRLVAADGQWYFAAEDCRLPVAENNRAGWRDVAGRTVSLGIRPEDVGLGKAGSGTAALHMEVGLVEPLGGTCLVTLRRGSWQLTAVTDIRNRPADGEAVEVAVNMQRTHLFDGQTGLAVGSGGPAG